MTKKTVLLTGATGFIGSHLLEELLKLSYRPVLIKRSTSDTWRIDQWLDRCDWYDIDKVSLGEVFGKHKIDAVAHLATKYNRNNQSVSELIRANIMFGVDLINECVKNNVKLFINTDSFYTQDKSGPGELDQYILSKKQFAEWLEQYSNDIGIINLKLHHVYGERDSKDKFVPWLTSEILNNKQIELTHGRQQRDFVYVRDVVSAYLNFLQKTEIEKGFSQHLVCTGLKTTLKNFCSTLNDEIRKATGQSAELCFGAKKYRPNELMDITNNNASLKSLGWTPRFSLEAGIREMLKSELSF